MYRKPIELGISFNTDVLILYFSNVFFKSAIVENIALVVINFEEKSQKIWRTHQNILSLQRPFREIENKSG